MFHLSQILTDILTNIRTQYLALLSETDGAKPLFTAEQLCASNLIINSDELAEIVFQDPTLLAARAGKLIRNVEESNPCAGLIIAANIHNAALEMLLDEAIENKWLVTNGDSEIDFDLIEIEAVEALEIVDVDYTVSKLALTNISQGGVSHLNQLLLNAEKEFLEQLEGQVLDAYTLAIQTAGTHSVFTPEELVPLIMDNPLMLALRADDLIIDEVFTRDPPAGIIISSHITQLIVEHLLELAAEKGALAVDSQGQLILPDSGDVRPVIH